MIRKLYVTIATLHQAGFNHWDCRVRNAICDGVQEVVWIDFIRGGHNDEPMEEREKFYEDIAALTDPLFLGKLSQTDDVFKMLLTEYATGLANAEVIVAHLLPLPQHVR